MVELLDLPAHGVGRGPHAPSRTQSADDVDDPLDAQAATSWPTGSSSSPAAVRAPADSPSPSRTPSRDDPEREVILKVARSAVGRPPAGRRGRRPARARPPADRPADRGTVRRRRPPALLLTDAGKETLAARLAKEGRATLGQLQQFGGDLLDVDGLPGRQGLLPPRHQAGEPRHHARPGHPQAHAGPLRLLAGRARASTTSSPAHPGTWTRTSAGAGGIATTGPQSCTPSRRRSSRWRRAVLPWWRRRLGPSPEPRATPPSSSRARSSRPWRPSSRQLFQRALNPDVKHRFSTADELAIAWQEVFASLDAGEETAESNDALAEAAVADTPLERSGLSARARSALARLDLATVGGSARRAPGADQHHPRSRGGLPQGDPAPDQANGGPGSP